MAGTFPSQRAENRSFLKVLVELYSFDKATFEFAYTIDVSNRGARIMSKMPWAPEQRLSIRSVHGHVTSRARVVYCQRLEERGYAVGLELHQPAEKWAESAQALATQADS